MIKFEGNPDFKDVKALEGMIQEKMTVTSKMYALEYANTTLKTLISEVLKSKIKTHEKAIKLYQDEINNLQRAIDEKTKEIHRKGKKK